MSIFPTSPVIGDRYSGYEWDGTVWQVVGIDFNQEYATTTDLSDHEIDTSNVHGIADTSLLATTSYVDTAESDAITTANEYSDSLASNYDPAGSASIAESNANSYTDTEISTHNSDTTNVHGIADTSALATKTYADNAASTAAANLIDSAPSTLDTLNELAAALGDDPNFATTVTNSLAGKVENSGDTITGPLAVDVDSTDVALRVTQTGSGDALVVEDSASPDSTPFVVTNTGNVGIGTSSPQRLLHVGAFGGLAMRLENTNVTNSYDTVLIELNTAGSNRVRLDGQQNGSGSGGNFIARIADESGTITERMRITSAGNVGIGTNSPTQTLHTYTALTGGSPATSGSGNDPNASARIQMASVALDVGTIAAGGAWLQSRQFNNYANNFPLILNPNGGNVGIGTSSPSYKLDVNGNARASNIMVIVDNGTDANYARPTGVGAVYWIGSAEPLNAAAYDMWWSG
jgi:hypothetical protein